MFNLMRWFTYWYVILTMWHRRDSCPLVVMWALLFNFVLLDNSLEVQYVTYGTKGIAYIFSFPCTVLSRPLFYFVFRAIVLSVHLQFRSSDYSHGVFKFALNNLNQETLSDVVVSDYDYMVRCLRSNSTKQYKSLWFFFRDGQHLICHRKYKIISLLHTNPFNVKLQTIDNMYAFIVLENLPIIWK